MILGIISRSLSYYEIGSYVAVFLLSSLNLVTDDCC